MRQAEEYLERAAECLEMANRAKTAHEKRVLLQIAKAWSGLAKTGTITPQQAPPRINQFAWLMAFAFALAFLFIVIVVGLVF